MDSRCLLSWFQGVYHAAGLGGPWYGSDNIIDSVSTREVPLGYVGLAYVFGSPSDPGVTEQASPPPMYALHSCRALGPIFPPFVDLRRAAVLK